MPGKRADGVKLYNVGVDEVLWEAARAKSVSLGKKPSVSEVMREALKAWLGHPDARYGLFTPSPPPE